MTYQTENTNIALRSLLWSLLRTAHPDPVPYARLSFEAFERGYKPQQVHEQLDAMRANGAIVGVIGGGYTIAKGGQV